MAAEAINQPTTSKHLHEWCHDNIKNYSRWRCTPNQTGNILAKMPEFKVAQGMVRNDYIKWENEYPSLTVWMLTRGYFSWYQRQEEE